MDALAQLALMTKAKLVFETSGTFLSFPALSPRTYAPDELAFADPRIDSVEKLAELADFSRAMNVMPGGVIAPDIVEEFLWDVYDEVLKSAQLAAGTLTPRQHRRYKRALAFLYTPTPEGLRQDSEALRAYRRFRDAHIAAQEEYRNRQSTAQWSDDPQVTAQWATDEPRLREAIAELERRWVAEGFRAEVEAAQRVVDWVAARSPASVWDEWKRSFLDVIDTATDTSQVEFATTSFSPYDIFSGGAWPSFTLTREEIDRLAAGAPPELAAIFGGSDGAGVEKISFEYRSVTLNRPWLRPELFRSRFWRLGAAGGELSDGGTPPVGRCPSYVAALVLARNVAVHRRAGGEDGTGPRLEPVGHLVRLPPAVLQRLELATVRPRAGVMTAPMPVVSRPAVAAIRPRSTLGVPLTLARAPEPELEVGRTLVAPPRAVLQARLASMAFPEGLRATEPPASPPPVAETAPPAEHAGEVTVLAYICRPLPRCPDPDPSLDWS